MRAKLRLTKSEILWIICNAVMLLLTLLFLYMTMFTERDASSFTTVMEVWAGVTTAENALYAWKEKAANKQKYAIKWLGEISDKVPPDVAARFAEIVLSD